MKTAISLPDGLFAAVERLVERSRRPRSEIYAAALREYVARHSPDEVTEALDRVVEQAGPPSPDAPDAGFAAAAARRVLEATEW